MRAGADGQAVAIEACARAHSRAGEGLSPRRMFADAVIDSDLANLNRPDAGRAADETATALKIR